MAEPNKNWIYNDTENLQQQISEISEREGYSKTEIDQKFTDAESAVDTKLANKADNSALSAEVADRETEDTRLEGLIDSLDSTKADQDSLTQEISDRQAADQSIRTDVNAAMEQEASARQSADTTLQTNIDTEKSDRISGDTTLATSIGNEAQARSDADTALNEAISKKADITALDQEIDDRKSADDSIREDVNVSIENEAKTRSDTDSQLLANINALDSNKQDKLIEGTAIDINGNTVNVKIDGTTIYLNSAGRLAANVSGGGGGGTTYTAGDGIEINGTVIKAKIDTSNLEFDSNGAITIPLMKTTMPTASASTIGRYILYTGATTTEAPIYKSGHFYIGMQDESTSPATYFWYDLGTFVRDEQLADKADLSGADFTGDVTIAQTLDVEGTATFNGATQLLGNTAVNDPTQDANISNKKYVDNTVSSEATERDNADTGIKTIIGALADLKTTVTTSIVNAINSLVTKFADYLPLAGGTMTGSIIDNTTHSSTYDNAFISRKDNKSVVNIWSANTVQEGASIRLQGGDVSGIGGTNGQFQIIARSDSSNYKILSGQPDGTLTWGNNDISGNTSYQQTVTSTYLKSGSIVITKCGKILMLQFNSCVWQNIPSTAYFDISCTSVGTRLGAVWGTLVTIDGTSCGMAGMSSDNIIRVFPDKTKTSQPAYGNIVFMIV